MKYIVRPVAVDAVQWSPDVLVPNLEVRYPQILISCSGKHYYVQSFGGGKLYDPQGRTAQWIPVDWNERDEKRPEIGQALPFAFWEVKVGEIRRALRGDPLVEAWLRYVGHEDLDEPFGLLEGGLGRDSTRVNVGDWVVTYPDGTVEVHVDVDFNETFIPVSSPDDDVLHLYEERVDGPTLDAIAKLHEIARNRGKK